ncbi:16S rRNA (guanine(966)-N(2))-methyltransferase RsmD [Abyssicoccus albus]|uniref:16S rRNA (guanine(966)-N(2))-methyltransferase RsmD n=1 Tax=Abyssicoccus albus TaxID=1817405 RepID=UPI00097E2565|nr:16S rRNA (guanine(966)-N(2))-methyltransferase RsmD [Abyssicoccus albus]AQL56387.1 16S rRNA (guanine(966)-N(2))-methyltransferase RsmD [Abyssicoccus albus]
MRIISGDYKGIQLDALKNNNTRPTSDKVKESMFNIISQDVISDRICLDLFAGSGGLGIEAISRGAARVFFIDGSYPAIKIIQQNINKLKGLTSDRSEVYRTDYKRAIKALSKRDMKLDVVFLDPPYRKGLVEDSLKLLDEYNVLNNGAHIMVEAESSLALNEEELLAKYQYEYKSSHPYGDIQLHYLNYHGS